MSSLLSATLGRRALGGSAIALALRPGIARAGSLTVAPILVDLGPGRSAATIEVTNQANAAVSVQIRAFAWSQQGDEDRLVPTPDILVSPAVTRLGPSEEQVIRLALRRAPGAEERTYRILLDELPEPAAQGQRQQQLNVAMRISLPVRVNGTAGGAPALSWRLESSGNRTIVIARNDGSTMSRVGRVELVGPGNRRIPVRPLGQSPYVLPGIERRWEAAAALPRGSTVRLLATTEAGPTERPLAVP